MIAHALVLSCFGLLLARVGAAFSETPSLLALFEHFVAYFAWAWGGVALASLAVVMRAKQRGRSQIIAQCVAVLASLMCAWDTQRWWSAGVPREPLVAASDNDLIVVWANLQHNTEHTTRLIEWLEQAEQLPHCVAVGETDHTHAIEELRAVFPYGMIDAASGLALLSRVEPIDQQSIILQDTRPILQLDLRSAHGNLRVYATHAHIPVHRSHSYTFDRLEELLPRDSAALLIGDFNTTPWSKKYQSLTENCELRDARQGAGAAVTWRATRLPLARLPIDHAFLRGGVELVSYEIGPDVGSDHLPIRVRLRPVAR